MVNANLDQPLRERAEALGSILPPLLVRAERVAATVVQGVHGRRRVGQGEAFWQFRRYQPGDATSRIDWRQSAKGRHVFVRENEWEAAQSVWLWRDGSGSMDFASDRTLEPKRTRADLLVLAMAALLLRGGERVALLDQGSPPRNSRAMLTRLAQELSQPGGDVPIARPLPRYGRVVLVSDFLSDLDQISRTVAAYADQGLGGCLLQVTDPAEETLPYQGRVRFEGFEGDGEVLVRRTEGLRDAYIARLAAHRAAIGDIARRAGWSFGRHTTSEPPERAVLWLYQALAGAEGR
ncbi:MAG: DUF58 domain-containing protein [Alphaproteobacteria bacterium]|nr:MAG: DUF58 domain-containing protein [Alphaproteobacteria bacterium]